MDNMKLSIITIAYNNLIGLTKTAVSVLSQTITDFEWIIVDGASTDGTQDYLSQIERQWRGKKEYLQILSEADSGIYNAMNKGIRMAHGEYCLFLNSGDYLFADSTIAEILLQKLSADIVSGNVIHEASMYHAQGNHTSPNILSAYSLINESLPHQGTLIRRSLFKTIHPYDESFRIVSDWLFSIEAILVRHCSYQHIQMFVSVCESAGISNDPNNMIMLEEERKRGLNKVLPYFYDDYMQLLHLRQENLSDFGLFKNKFFASYIGHSIYGLRKYLIQRGFFDIKNRWTQKCFFRRLVCEDNKRKKDIRKCISTMPDGFLETAKNKAEVVVSLTSYGKRVLDALPYALYSMLVQEQLPSRIIVYLDKKTCVEDKLLKEIALKGVEFRFCKDVRSFTKLVPALLDFPDTPIITIDDDIYYDNRLVADLYAAYQKSDKHTVIGVSGLIAQKRNGNYLPYSQWQNSVWGNEYSDYSLYGVSGIIYPPHIFDDEITKSDIFLSLCPTADDIWFWAMEKRQSIATKMLPPREKISVNRIEEYDLTQKGTLLHHNVTHGANDGQMERVIKKYNL